MEIDERSWVGYIHDMTKQLAIMARDRGLEHLASLLDVAALEAKTEIKNGEDARRQ
jgi:hypothetical protein